LRRQLPDDNEPPRKPKPGEEPEEKLEDVQLKEAITVLRGYVILAQQETADIGQVGDTE
jgi:hypothetical protein